MLAAHEWDSFIEPLLTLEMLEMPLPPLNGIRGLVFTSVNGVNAFAARADTRMLPVYAVGDATAAAAFAAGFTQVTNAAGQVTALNRLLAERNEPGPLLHIGGADRAAAVVLKDKEILHLSLYKMQAAAALSTECLARLRAGTFTHAMFFSARTGETFRTLMGKQATAVNLTKALCLSNSVLKSVSGLPWRAMAAAARPDLPGMLDILNES